MNEVIESLRGRGFDARTMATGAEAAEFVLNLVGPGSTVGIGGCVTAEQLALDKKLLDAGARVYWHWRVEPCEIEDERLRAVKSDYYISSVGALTTGGEMVNIDGNGNRQTGIMYGPKTVFLIVGRNKLVDGGTAEAISRIKSQACGKNARRLHLSTPCATTDRCISDYGCKSPQRMCRLTQIISMCPTTRKIYVLLVDEDLGF